MKPYDYQRELREAAEGRPSIIQRYRSLLKAAASAPLSNATQYEKGARQLRARHQLTDAEVGL